MHTTITLPWQFYCVLVFFLSDLRFTPSLSFEATSDRVPFSMGRTCVVMEIPTVALLPRNDVVVEYLPSLRGGYRPTWHFIHTLCLRVYKSIPESACIEDTLLLVTNVTMSQFHRGVGSVTSVIGDHIGTKVTIETKGMAQTFLLIATSLWSLRSLRSLSLLMSQCHRGWGSVTSVTNAG